MYTRYTNGIEDYCIHGMSMTSKCDYCKEIREQEIRDLEQVKMPCRCAKCDIVFASVGDYQKHKCGMENKMTREEAKEKTKHIISSSWMLETLEALGLLKFDESKKEVEKIFAITEDANVHWCNYPNTSKRIIEKYGTIRLEEWPEGLVLWVGGEIRWKSWEKSYKKGDAVSISTLVGGAAGIII